MRISTALCLALSSAAAALAARPRDFAPTGKGRSRTAAAPIGLAGLAGIIGAVSLLASLWAWHSGGEAGWTNGVILRSVLSAPLRMAPVTAAMFVGIAAALFLLVSRSRRVAGIGHAIAIPIWLASCLVLISYLFDVESLRTWMDVQVALNTDLALGVLVTLLFLIRTDTWFTRVIASREAGGAVGRRLMPAVIAVPILIGWVRFHGERAGALTAPVAGALAVVANSLVLFWVMWLVVRSANAVGERHRQAELARRQSEENYRSLVEMSPDALLVHRDLQIEQVNRAALVLLGAKTREDLIGRSIFEIYHPECHAVIRERVIRELAGEPAPLIEEKIARMDGSVRDVEVAGSLCQGSRGPAVQVILRDITERKRAERELRAAHLELSAIHDSAPVALIVVDGDMRVRKMNEAAGRFAGRADSEMPGLRPGDAIGCLNATADARGCGYGPACGDCAIRGAVLEGLNNQVRRDGFEAWVRLAAGERCLLVSTAPLNLPGGAEVLICALDITERKLAEQALRQQREWLRVTLASIGDAVLATDAAGRVRLLNPAAAHLTGWSEAEAIGRPAREIFRVIKARTGETAGDVVARVLEEKAAVSLENSAALVARDGREIPIEDSAAPIRDTAAGADSPAGAVLVFHDISEKKRAQEALRQSEERLRVIAESTPDHIVVQDLSFRYVLVANPQFGFAVEEMIGKTDHDLLPSDDADRLDEIKHRVVQTGQAVRAEIPLTSRRGGEQFFDGSYVPKFDSRGRPDGVIGYFRNVTARKRAEDDLRQARGDLEKRFEERTADLVRFYEALREREEKYRLLSEISADIIVTHDPGGRLTYVNQAGLSLAGYSGTEALSLSVSQILTACAPDPAQSAGYEAELIAKSGQRIPVDVRSAPILRQGQMVGTLVNIRDISARKQDEAELEQYRHHLEELVAHRAHQLELANAELERAAAELEARNYEVERANRMKTEFLARMSHELRTPLNAIVGYADLLAEEPAGPLPPKYKRFIGNVREGAHHLLRIVNDVLDLSRIEAGRIDLSREPFYSQDALNEVLSVIAPLAGIKRIAIDNRLPAGMRVNADRTRVKQILYNLLSNAVKFTPEEGRIWVEDCSRDDTACVCVGDTGIGISAEDLASLFEDFSRVKAPAAAAKEGAGLGLAITRRLAVLHGGAVWAESQPGDGSRFYFSLGPHSIEPPVAVEAKA